MFLLLIEEDSDVINGFFKVFLENLVLIFFLIGPILDKLK